MAFPHPEGEVFFKRSGLERWYFGMECRLYNHMLIEFMWNPFSQKSSGDNPEH